MSAVFPGGLPAPPHTHTATNCHRERGRRVPAGSQGHFPGRLPRVPRLRPPPLCWQLPSGARVCLRSSLGPGASWWQQEVWGGVGGGTGAPVSSQPGCDLPCSLSGSPHPSWIRLPVPPPGLGGAGPSPLCPPPAVIPPPPPGAPPGRPQPPAQLTQTLSHLDLLSQEVPPPPSPPCPPSPPPPFSPGSGAPSPGPAGRRAPRA